MLKQITECTKWIVTALYRSLVVSLLRLKVAKFLSLSLSLHRTEAGHSQAQAAFPTVTNNKDSFCNYSHLLPRLFDTLLSNAPVCLNHNVLKKY